MAAGIRRATIDGVAVDVVELGEFSIATEKRETVKVLAGNHGKRVEKAVPYCELTILIAGIRIADYIGQESVLVQIDDEDGQSYVWKDAHEVGDGAADIKEGKLKLRYESDEASQL